MLSFFLLFLLNTHTFIDQLQEAHRKYTEHLQMELNEERTCYQNLMTEHIKLEAQYADLRSEREAATVSAVYTHFYLKTSAISAG